VIIIKKTFRWLIYTILILLSLMIITAAVVRFVIFPNINSYKDDIATKITEKIGLKTTIGHIVTGWDGISPQIVISEIDIYDKGNNSALHLNNVKGTFSWLSIPTLHPHLSYISISDPTLKIQRTEDGNLYVAGIALGGEGTPDFPNWILSQAHIRIKNATVAWQDNMRKAPPLSLDNVNLTLKNPAWRKIFGQHLFSISALPSTGTNQPIIVDGNFFGRDVSKMKTWHGSANLDSKNVDLTAWKNWIDYPIDLQSGHGDASVSLTFSNTQLDKIKGDIELHEVMGRLNQDKQPFNANLLSGTVSWERAKNTTTLTAKNIKLNAEGELNIEGGAGFVSYTTRDSEPWVNASLQLNTFNLNFLSKLQQVIAIPDNLGKALNGLSPQGKLNNLILSLQGNPAKPSHYRIASTFDNLSVNPYRNIPGISQLGGQIDANEDNGTLILNAHKAAIDLKGILRWPIPLNTVTGKITWSNKGRFKVIANNIYLENEHIKGNVNASYDMNGIKGGYIDINGEFDEGNAKFAPYYYPLIMGKDTMEWLDSSILEGKANSIQLAVKGHVDDFPYVDKQNNPDPNKGVFKVTARISDAVLEYGKSWPKIQGVGLDMLFEGNSMELNADKGNIYGIKINKGKAVIPELNTYGKNNQVLIIEGLAEGLTSDGVDFINNSPVKQVTLGFTDDLKTAGTGKLNLNLSIPLNNIEGAKYKGQYTIQNGVIHANERMGLPDIDKLTGQLNFDQSGINAERIQAEILEGLVQFDINTASDQTININAEGTINDAGIKHFAQNMFTEALVGTTNWSADIAIKKPVININIRSDLKGLAINLPAPLKKSTSQEAKFSVTKLQTTATQDQIELDYNNIISAVILRNEKNGDLTFERGNIAINTSAKLPNESGLTMNGEFDYINADEWLDLANASEKSSATPKNPSVQLKINSTNLSIKQLEIFNRTLNAISIKSTPQDRYLQLNIDSQEITGDVEWYAAKNIEETGKIIANLKKLHIPASNNKEEDKDKDKDKDIKRLNKKYPALDIKAQDFKLAEKPLGMLELKAFEVNDDWVIEQLKISNPDHVLLAEGRWHNWARNPNTNLEFSLAANDIGKTMKRFGQSDTVKGGVALISGKLQWAGSPHQFKKDGLNGTFTLGASKGQIIKIQPGVGRLLGLLTLQSLPRRLTLDFRDLFSEGFAFDVISATAKIENGVMHSDDFFMTGPAAETEIKGDINLNKETQNLKVKVVPHISDTLSLAALAGGPIAGAAAFVAQKILKDPLNKIAQSEYVITGTWDKPVEAGATKENETKKPSPSPLTAQ
jgi:uncharacterized protein (TIGR02099 family)